jgi:hypothetical protein
LELEEVAYCKNRISAEKFEEHLEHMMLYAIEPNYQTFVRNLRRYDQYKRDCFDCDQAMQALTHIYPPAPTFLKKYLIDSASMYSNDRLIPIPRVAYLAAYMLAWVGWKIEKWENVPLLDISGDNFVSTKCDIVIPHGKNPLF